MKAAGNMIQSAYGRKNETRAKTGLVFAGHAGDVDCGLCDDTYAKPRQLAGA